MEMEDRPHTGLVLGAGSARGLAHIGVMQVLLENNIPFDFIVGSSMGAMVG
ncbi:MAG TPA: esterase, partial [Syntrophomonas sp.]|nr:esterase [Syntrophomonas sp.]